MTAAHAVACNLCISGACQNRGSCGSCLTVVAALIYGCCMLSTDCFLPSYLQASFRVEAGRSSEEDSRASHDTFGRMSQVRTQADRSRSSAQVKTSSCIRYWVQSFTGSPTVVVMPPRCCHVSTSVGWLRTELLPFCRLLRSAPPTIPRSVTVPLRLDGRTKSERCCVADAPSGAAAHEVSEGLTNAKEAAADSWQQWRCRRELLAA